MPSPWQKPDAKTGELPRGLADHAVHLDYLRHISGVDENIIKLLGALDTLGLAEDTVVVYASDNGYFLGEHCSGDKRSLYDESLRNPFLVRYPRVFGKGITVDEMALNLDLAPTFLDLTGVPVPTCYALRTTTHKLVKYPNRPEWTEAFDLAADPYEIKNLAFDSELTAKLETELTAMMTTVKYNPPVNANKPR